MSKDLETDDYPREEYFRQKEVEEEGPEARAYSFLAETEKRSAWLKGLTRGNNRKLGQKGIRWQAINDL